MQQIAVGNCSSADLYKNSVETDKTRNFAVIPVDRALIAPAQRSLGASSVSFNRWPARVSAFTIHNATLLQPRLTIIGLPNDCCRRKA